MSTRQEIVHVFRVMTLVMFALFIADVVSQAMGDETTTITYTAKAMLFFGMTAMLLDRRK